MDNFEIIFKDFESNIKWKKLNELFYIDNVGVDKKKRPNESEVILLNFMDVYNNTYIEKDIPKMIVTSSDKKIHDCSVLKGDIFFTPSSETKDDIGITSVISEDIPNCVYSYHIVRLRLKEKNYISSCFYNYYFKSIKMKDQIFKNSNGITRFTINKKKIEDLIIPIVSIEKQK